MLHVHGRQYLCNQIEQWHINDHGEHAQDSTGTVPLPLKSPPSNHWHYCSVLPRESFHCRSAHRPNDPSQHLISADMHLLLGAAVTAACFIYDSTSCTW